MSASITTWVGNGIERANSKTPLVILLHGYGANEVDLPPIMDSITGDMPWIAPRAPIAVGSGAFGWYPMTLPLNPDVATTSTATDRLWAWIDAHVAQDVPLKLVGFSQGGFMASQLLRTRPERITKTAILSGFVSGHQQPADERLRALMPHVFYAVGLHDTMISQAAIDRALGWLDGHTFAECHQLKNLGHSINELELQLLSKYLQN
jgi:phospholipase/carboxylesterase